MRRQYIAPLLLLAACGNPPPVVEKPAPTQASTSPTVSAIPETAPAPAPVVQTPRPEAAAPPPKEAPTAAPPKVATPAALPKAATPSAPPKAATQPVPPVAAAAPKPAPLDLKTLEQRLRSTGAIGVLTKLSLKNQVDDLIARFKTFHAGQRPPTLTELRPAFDLLLMKVLSLLQDEDKTLASDINASREALWSVLTDRDKLSAYL
jgi:hypothetical protein